MLRWCSIHMRSAVDADPTLLCHTALCHALLLISALTSPAQSVYVKQPHGYVFHSQESSLEKKIHDFNEFILSRRNIYKVEVCEGCVKPCAHFNDSKAQNEPVRFRPVRAFAAMNTETQNAQPQNATEYSHITKYKFYNYLETKAPGLVTFVLSFQDSPSTPISHNGRHYMDILPIKQYFRCVTGASSRRAGGFNAISAAMTRQQCQATCSENITDMSIPQPLAKESLFTDYSFTSYWVTCDYFKDLSIGLAHIQNFVSSQIVTALDILTVGGMVTIFGDVFTNNKYWLYPFACGFDPKMTKLSTCNIPETHVIEVFIITQRPTNFNNYHFMIEIVPRLAPFVTFLKANPHIWIHTRRESQNIMPLVLEVFGLRNRLVYGNVQADVIYMPHGGACLNPHLASIQLTALMFQTYSQERMKSEAMNPTIVLIKRSRRSLRNHEAVRDLLEKHTQDKALDLVEFDDSNLPSYEDRLPMFYRAALVIGPHGAGLSNIIFSRPGTVVIDIQCRSHYARPCFRSLALKLGMHYYGMVTTNQQAMSRRCDQEGIVADLVELDQVLDFVFERMLLH